MYKILISGYYGFNNIGDESILSAVTDNLKEKLEDIEITVLSQNPEATAERYQVKSCSRKSFFSILKAMIKTDLLISGGGSLLQDVTSKKSILYYLAIIWMAVFLRKPFFIYSQGIGPISSNFNRKITARTLKKAAAIVVRDDNSKEFLLDMGFSEESIVVTADPVLRIRKVDLDRGKQILKQEGIELDENKMTVGFAIKERNLGSEFVSELCKSMEWLIKEKNAQIVLIPFHFSEDMAVIEAIENKLGDNIFSLKHKYLTKEMLSVIGNMDILVGVRLHALIHAAIMNVPMIAIAYDPKINSFMNSIDMKAMSSIHDFRANFFQEEYDKTLKNKDVIEEQIKHKLKELVAKLDENEKLIMDLRKGV